ncbi:MAG: aminopeptidase P family protein [Mycoplasmataceae bacterium]|nr:aminopeptidase P family protein [Mycoplasmataceae bacterium]
MFQKNQAIFDLIKVHKADSLISISSINRSWLLEDVYSDFCLFMCKDNEIHAFVDERDFQNIQLRFKHIIPHLYQGIDSWLSFCKSLNLKRTIFESNQVYYDDFNTFIKPVCKHLIPLNGDDLRIVKTPKELSRMQKAADITCEAVNYLKKWVKIGMTETKVADEFYRLVMSKGASGLSFPTIVGFGENSANIHGTPTERKLKRNEMILMDCGCVYKGYHSDMTRVWWLGVLPKRAMLMYKVILAANKLGIEKAKAGMTGIQLDKVCRDYVKEHWNFYDLPHGTGHGVGLQIHENPRANKTYTGKLVENCVVTVEPGIYDQQICGVRIEDSIVITKNGCKVLTSKCPK